MNLLLKRIDFSPRSTIGTLSIDGSFFCHTLEDTVRGPGVKIPGKTAIPNGKYQIVITFSNRFQKQLPLLMNVPMFEGIRIHPGNTDKDTEGCILVGKETNQSDFISSSRVVFDVLFAKIKAAMEHEKVYIEVV